MAADAIISNPIGWVQLQLLGGWRKLLAITGVYAAIVLVALMVIYRAVSADDPTVTPSNFAGNALIGVTLIELAIIFFFGTTAIKKAIHRDFTSDMITSHRCSAMTGYTAVFGYLTGPTIQIAAITIVNWLIGTILAAMAGLNAQIFAPTAILFVFGCLAAMIYSLSVLVGLSTRGSLSMVGLVLVVLFTSNAGLINVLPGVSLVMLSATVTKIGSATAAGLEGMDMLAAMGLQLALALTFFLAAARKFARDDVPAFNPVLAFCMLALASLVSVVGLGFSGRSRSLFGMAYSSEARIQLIATVAFLALVALLPVANAALNGARWAKRKARDAEFTDRAPRSYVETALAATLLVFGILIVSNAWALNGAEFDPVGGRHGPAYAWIISAFVLNIVSAGALLRYTYSVAQKANWLIIAFLIATWVFPLLAESIYVVALNIPRGDNDMSMLLGCSPLGTWIMTLADVSGPVVPGLIVQGLICAGCLAFAARAKK